MRKAMSAPRLAVDLWLTMTDGIAGNHAQRLLQGTASWTRQAHVRPKGQRASSNTAALTRAKVYLMAMLVLANGPMRSTRMAGAVVDREVILRHPQRVHETFLPGQHIAAFISRQYILTIVGGDSLEPAGLPVGSAFD